MRVLVTGGAGYIGSVIVARLTARGHDVVVYDDLSRGHAAAVPEGVPLVRGDVRDTAAVRAALVEGGCEAVVHMAALAEVAESVAEPDRYFSVNVDGTAAVVEAAAAAGAGRLVFSSTAAVYGAPERTPIDEGDTLAPANPYGETKLAGERLLQRGAVTRRARRDRPPLLQRLRRRRRLRRGPRPRVAPHPAGAARRARRPADPRVRRDYPTPDGTCVRDYVHVADLADAHIAALEALPGVQGSFNLGYGDGRLGAGRARRRRGCHRPAPAAGDGGAACGRPAGPASRATSERRRAWDGVRGGASRTPSPTRGRGCASTRTGTRSDEVERRRSRREPASGRRQPTAAGSGASDSRVMEPSTSMSWLWARSQASCTEHDALRAQSSGLSTH